LTTYVLTCEQSGPLVERVGNLSPKKELDGEIKKKQNRSLRTAKRQKLAAKKRNEKSKVKRKEKKKKKKNKKEEKKKKKKKKKKLPIKLISRGKIVSWSQNDICQGRKKSQFMRRPLSSHEG